METLTTILTRRSVRQFTNQIVSDDIIEKLLNAAMHAPSAMNKQPWHFVVIKDKTLIDSIATVHPYAKMCMQANLVIIPCVDQTIAHDNYGILDVAAATQNILLAVRDFNLGAVWCGIYPNPERIQKIRNLCNLPETVIPLCIIPIGYTTIKQLEANRFRADRVHYDKW